MFLLEQQYKLNAKFFSIIKSLISSLSKADLYHHKYLFHVG